LKRRYDQSLLSLIFYRNGLISSTILLSRTQTTSLHVPCVCQTPTITVRPQLHKIVGESFVRGKGRSKTNLRFSNEKVTASVYFRNTINKQRRADASKVRQSTANAWSQEGSFIIEGVEQIRRLLRWYLMASDSLKKITHDFFRLVTRQLASLVWPLICLTRILAGAALRKIVSHVFSYNYSLSGCTATFAHANHPPEIALGSREPR